MIGKALPDKTVVKDNEFSPALTGFLTLLVLYMLVGTITDPRDDKEGFAKGSLPINLKTPFWQVFKFALNDRERLLFEELYGKKAVRQALFGLARAGASAADGATKLFPSRTHWDLERFHTSLPTWDTLVDLTMSGTPLKVDKANTVRKKKHEPGDEILFAPMSSKLDFDKTKPRIAVELRRIGFQLVGLGRWEDLMKRVRELTRQLNA
jgi:hypothetical protein